MQANEILLDFSVSATEYAIFFEVIKEQDETFHSRS